MKNQESVWDKLYSTKLSWKREAKNMPSLLEGKRVLELGVGNGKTLISILAQNPKSVTAIDFSLEALNKAKEAVKSDKVHFIKTNLLELPFNEEFDVIVCYYVLNNLMEIERKRAIVQMFKSLKHGGIILFEDFAVKDFREKGSANEIEEHTIEREDGLICHFFRERELNYLFKSFKSISISQRAFHPIKARPKIERKIISAVIKK